MTAEPAPDHPGRTASGQPGDIRYLCPFCWWFVDVDPDVQPAVIEGLLGEHLTEHATQMAEGVTDR